MVITNESIRKAVAVVITIGQIKYMKNLKSFGTCLLVVFVVFTAKADDDCTADVTKYSEENFKTRKSIFKANANSVETVLPSKLSKYGFEDQVKLKNGIEVTYKAGGCAHYAYRFIFSGKGIRKVQDSEKLKRAESLLKNLELTQDEEKDLLLRALSEAKKKSLSKMPEEVFRLPCGDANCELIDRGDGVVEINYDFPL